MRILLSRTDRVGDLILSTPAIATVRKSFPHAHVTIACSVYNRVVMERNTDVDRIIALPREVKPSAFASSLRGQFDVAVALAPRIADWAIVGASQAPVRLGYTYMRRYLTRLSARRYLTRLILSHADPLLAESQPAHRVLHEVDQLLSLVAIAGADRRVRALRIDVDDADRAAVAHLPIDPITFHLGKRWFSGGSTLRSAVELVGELKAFGAPVVVTYAPECAAAANDFGVNADALAGNLTFHQWAAAFERSRCVVTVDTGATHVASAMGRPLVVAFEHRYFALSSQEWAPYRVPYVAVRKPAGESADSLRRLRAEVCEGVSRLIRA
ncbi:MAG: hypothetical protein DLM50_04915 [Candidatus Meridianibacter frigidus]|nr:MAG: hypothetical protein DLM50_04915 [Candidatus Eremiobacteraeota bacterium]